MIHNRTRQIKAFILVIVFSLSTIMSFACSLGLDMGYNSGHHIKELEALKCCEKPAGNSEKQDSEEDDCCTNSVINFQLMAKSVAQNNIDFSTPISVLHHDMMELLLALNYFSGLSEMKQAVFRTTQLPPPDIRVSIRSFQI